MLTVLTQRGLKYSCRFLNGWILKNIDQGPRFQYFAFGANMDPELLRKKEIYPRSSKKCELKDYQLKIDVPCEYLGKGFASVSISKGDSVWGVVHDISFLEMLYIDVLEWVLFSFHKRVADNVQIEGEETSVKTWFYVAGSPRGDLKTSNGYKQMLLDAANKFDFPMEYIRSIEDLPTGNKFDYDHGFRLSNPSKRRYFEKELRRIYSAHDKLRDKLCSII